MKIIAPSYEILAHLDQQSLAVRIEYCGRICYKSEDRITQESALPFVEKMAEHGHNSVLEMGVVTLEVCAEERAIADLFVRQPKYLHISREGNCLLITGSIRAFREMLLFQSDCEIVQAVCALLNDRHPYFFRNILPARGLSAVSGIAVRKVPLEEVEGLAESSNVAKHRHIAVKFIVNRAVTHEIVRHRIASYLQESQRYCRYSDDKFGNEVTFIKPMFWQEGSEEYALWQQAMEASERHYLRLLETSTAQAARTVLPNSCKTEIIVYANLEQWQHIFKLRCSKAAEPSMREVMEPLREEFRQWLRDAD